jgi:hypothetical protein
VFNDLKLAPAYAAGRHKGAQSPHSYQHARRFSKYISDSLDIKRVITIIRVKRLNKNMFICFLVSKQETTYIVYQNAFK